MGLNVAILPVSLRISSMTSRPGPRLTIFNRGASLALLQLVWVDFTFGLATNALNVRNNNNNYLPYNIVYSVAMLQC